MAKSNLDSKSCLDDLLKQKLELDQSIKYASYIQRSLLPSDNDLKSALNEVFTCYLPRDIVSGDFYWVHKDKDSVIVAVGDSTGHGIPGAFLSILGLTYLNLVVSKYKPNNAADILNYLREHIMHALNQTGELEEQKDGIDLSVCLIDRQTNKLSYSGAFNPVYIIRNEELIQLDSDKMPVGIGAVIEKSFSSKNIQLESNDTVYMFTDGFADQFGGEHGKKYKYPNFRKLLIESSKLPLNEQKYHIIDDYEKWKGDLPQLDDILILGFKYLE